MIKVKIKGERKEKKESGIKPSSRRDLLKDIEHIVKIRKNTKETLGKL